MSHQLLKHIGSHDQQHRKRFGFTGKYMQLLRSYSNHTSGEKFSEKATGEHNHATLLHTGNLHHHKISEEDNVVLYNRFCTEVANSTEIPADQNEWITKVSSIKHLTPKFSWNCSPLQSTRYDRVLF